MSKCIVKVGTIKSIASKLRLGKFRDAVQIFKKLDRQLLQQSEFREQFKKDLNTELGDEHKEQVDKLVTYYNRAQGTRRRNSPSSEFLNTEDEGLLNNTKFESSLGNDQVLISSILNDLKVNFVEDVLISQGDLNKKVNLIKNLQSKYYSDLYNYLGEKLGISKTLFTPINDQTQDTYNGDFDLYSARIKSVLTKGGTLTTLDLLNEYNKDSKLWKAYRAFVILSNFDYLLKRVSEHTVKVAPTYMNQITSFGSKYTILNINSAYTTWRDSDEDVDYTSEMGALAKLVMGSTPLYVRGHKTSGYMTLKRWSNMWSKIRYQVTWQTDLSKIKVSQVSLNGEPEEVQKIKEKFQGKTVGYLITKSLGDQEALELLFNILAKGNIERPGMKRGTKRYDPVLKQGNFKDQITSVFKRVFDRTNEKALINLDSKGADIYFFITKALTTISPMNYLQLELEYDDNNAISGMKYNYLSSFTYDQTRKDFEGLINSRFNRISREYWDSFCDKYNITYVQEKVDEKTKHYLKLVINGKVLKLDLGAANANIVQKNELNELKEADVKKLFRSIVGSSITDDFFKNFKGYSQDTYLNELLQYCAKVICNAYINLETVSIVIENTADQKNTTENDQEIEKEEIVDQSTQVVDSLNRVRNTKDSLSSVFITDAKGEKNLGKTVIIAFRQNIDQVLAVNLMDREDNNYTIKKYDSVHPEYLEKFVGQFMNLDVYAKFEFNRSLGNNSIIDKSLLPLSMKIAQAIDLTNGTEAKGVDRDSQGNALGNTSPCRVFEHYDYITDVEIRRKDGSIYPVYEKFSAINDVDNIVSMREIRNGEKAINLSRQEMYYISIVHDFYNSIRAEGEKVKFYIHPFVLSDKSTVIKAQIDRKKTLGEKSIDDIAISEVHEKIREQLGHYYNKVAEQIAQDWELVEQLLRKYNPTYNGAPIYNPETKTFNQNIKYKDIVEVLAVAQYNGESVPNIYEEVHCVVDKQGKMHFNKALEGLINRFSNDQVYNDFVNLQNLNLLEALFKDNIELPAKISNSTDWQYGTSLILAKVKAVDKAGNIVYNPIYTLEQFNNAKKLNREIIINPEIEKHNWFCYLYGQQIQILTMGGYIADKAKVKYGYNQDGSELPVDPLEEDWKRSLGACKRASSVATPLDLYQPNKYGIPKELNIVTFETPSSKAFNFMGDTGNVLNMDGAMFVSGVTTVMQNKSLGASAAGTNNQKAFGEAKDPVTGTHIQLKMASFGMTGNNQGRSEELRTMNLKSLELPLNDTERHQLVQGIIKFAERFGFPEVQGNLCLAINYLNDFGDITKVIVSVPKNSTTDTINIIYPGSGKSITDYKLKNIAELYTILGAERRCTKEGKITVASAEQVQNLLAGIICEAGLKNKVIHYFCPKDSMKRGYANVNSYESLLTRKPVAFQRVNMTFFGLLLDKTHETEGAKVSILSQVVNALCSRGYTESQAMETYKALEQVALSGVQDLIDINEDIIKNEENPNKIREDIKELRRVVAQYVIKESAFKQDSVLSAIVDKYKDYYDKGILKFRSELPLSSGNVFNQFNTIISSVISRVSIKMKFDGTLSVLTPSQGIYKIFGRKGLDQYASRNELVRTRRVFDEGLVNNQENIQIALQKGMLLPPHKISLGTSYNVYDENGNLILDKISGQPKIERILSPSDYYRVRDQYKYFKEVWYRRGSEIVDGDFKMGNYYEVIKPDGESIILKYGLENQEYFNNSKVYDFIVEGRDLEPYNVYFKVKIKTTSVGENGELTEQEQIKDCCLWDLKIVHDMYQDKNNRDRKGFQETLHNINSGKDIILYDGVDGVQATVISESVEVKPYENISNPTSLSKLGIPEGTKLSEITIEYFRRKLSSDLKSKIEPTKGNNDPIYGKNGPRQWNYEIKRLTGNHIYIIDTRDPSIDMSDYSEYSPEYRSRGDLLDILDDEGNVEFTIDANQDVTIYTNSQGYKVIATDNPDSILDLNIGIQIVYNANGKDPGREVFAEQLTKYPNLVSTGSDNQIENRDFTKQAIQLYNSFQQTLYNLVARIPSQSMQSFMAMKTVAFDNTGENNLYVSPYQIWLQGSDYDIDTATVLGFDLDRNGLISKWSPLFNYDTRETLQASLTLPFPTGENIKQPEDDEVFEDLDSIIQDEMQLAALEERLKDKQTLTAQDIRNLAKIIRAENSKQGVSYTGTSKGNTVDYTNIMDAVKRHNNYTNLLRKKKKSIANIAKNFVSYNMYSIIENPINIIQAQAPIDDVTAEGKELAQGKRSIVVPIYKVSQSLFESSDTVTFSTENDYVAYLNTAINNETKQPKKDAPYLRLIQDINNPTHYIIDFTHCEQLSIEDINKLLVSLRYNVHKNHPEGFTYSLDGIVDQKLVELLLISGDGSNIVGTKILEEHFVPNITPYENLAGNIYNNGKQQATNLTGKEGVSVSAAQMKGVLGVIQTTNIALSEIIPEDGADIDKAKYITFAQDICGKQYRIIANAYTDVLSKIGESPTRNQELVAQSKQLYDALLIISALISLSADNAKDLVLNKVMAIKEFMNLYTAGAMIGMSMGEVSRVAISKITKWAYPRMRDNVFTGRKGFKSIGDIIRYGECGPELNQNIKDDLGRLLSNSNSKEFMKQIPPKPSQKGEGEEYSSNSRMADDEAEWIKQGIFYVAFLSPNARFVTVEHLDALKNSCESKEMLEWIEFLKIIKSDKIHVLGDNNMVVEVSLWEELKKLYSIGSELLQVSSIFKVNKEIPTDLLEKLKFKKALQEVLVRAYRRQRDNNIVSYAQKSTKPKNPGTVSISQLLSGDQSIIDSYEEFKSAVNIPLLIISNPHYLGYLKAFQGVISTQEKTSRKFRFISKLYDEVAELVKPRTEKEEKAIIRTIENHVDALIINEWMRNRDIKIEMPKGIRLVNSFHKPFTPAVDGLPINLGTSWGNASFVNYMHHIFKVIEDIINNEYDSGELKDFLRINDEELDEFINEVKNNSFLKSLELRTEERTLSGNARIVYTANLRLIGDQEQQNLTIQTAQQDLERLATVKLRGQSLFNLLFLYNAIVFNDKPSKFSFSKLFINSVSKGSSELINDYYKYSSNWDSVFTPREVLAVDEKGYSYRDIPEYLSKDIAEEVAFSGNNKATYHKVYNGFRYVLKRGESVGKARNSYRLPSIKLTSKNGEPKKQLTVSLSPNITITINNAVNNESVISSIFYNGTLVDIDEALKQYNERHSDDTPITAKDLVFSRIQIAQLETKPDENGNTKQYQKVISRDLDVTRTLQSIERLLNDPC